MYEKGDKKLKWDEQPLYLPMLILPKSKFVFMFNYSDEPEELEEGLDWEDAEEDKIDKHECLSSTASNPVFDFLKDPQEDIYTLVAGKPFND